MWHGATETECLSPTRGPQYSGHSDGGSATVIFWRGHFLTAALFDREKMSTLPLAEKNCAIMPRLALTDWSRYGFGGRESGIARGYSGNRRCRLYWQPCMRRANGRGLPSGDCG